MPPQTENQIVPEAPKKPIRLLVLTAIMIVIGLLSLWYLSCKKDENPDLVVNQNLVASSTPEISDWKTYRNEEYGFEFKYPEGVLIEEDNKNVRIEKLNYTDEKERLDANEFFIESWNFSLEELKSYKLSNFKEGMLNGYKTYEGDDLDAYISPLGPRMLFLSKNDLKVTFAIYTGQGVEVKSLVDQILSTFKFISTSTEVVDTSTWKTYRNEELGFEFGYPEGWIIESSGSGVPNLADGIVIVKPKDIEYPYSGITLRVNENDVDGYIKNLNKGKVTQETEQQIGNFKWTFLVYTPNNDDVGRFIAISQFGTDLITVSALDTEHYTNPLKDVLSTFKFIEKEEAGKAGESGIKGIVTIGPVCPVMMNPPDSECADKPYKTKLRILKADTDYVVFAEPDINGNFSVDLEPGSYFITVPDLSKPMPSLSETRVTVFDKKYSEINLQFDSGIR